MLHALHRAPGPSPWYCRNPVPSALGPLRWVRSKVRDHISLLVDLDNCPYLALPFYVWFRSLEDGRVLLWRQLRSADQHVMVEIAHLGQLRPLEELEAWSRQAPEPDGPYYSVAPEFRETFRFNPAIDARKHRIAFPKGFADVPEFFVVADNLLVPVIPDGANRCVYAVDGRAGTIDVLPQDWFNRGPIDIGYEWITQITRDPATGRLIGGGIRIKNFVLDETGRNIEARF